MLVIGCTTLLAVSGILRTQAGRRGSMAWGRSPLAWLVNLSQRNLGDAVDPSHATGVAPLCGRR